MLYWLRLAMTQQAVSISAKAPIDDLPSVNKKQLSVGEIVESFECVGADILAIGKLTSVEKPLVQEIISRLKICMQPLTSSVPISAAVLPFKLGMVAKAEIASTGHLMLTFEDGQKETLDLSEPKNRDLLVAVIDYFLANFSILIGQSSAERLKFSVSEPQIQEITILKPIAPEPLVIKALPEIKIEIPFALPYLGPAETEEEIPEPQELPEAQTPGLSAHQIAQIEAIKRETLDNLDLLGNEVFEHSPVSKYFDDWMVNLRQVIMSFESSDVIGPDEGFAQVYNQIFSSIEEELSRRMMNDAQIEVSAKTLVENRYLLKEIDDGYVAETKRLVVQGKSNIEYMIRSVQLLEAELSEVNQIKTSYRHPLKKLAKDQKLAELTQKLTAAKKRLALTVANSSVDKGDTLDVDAEYSAQTHELAQRRQSAIDFLSKNVADLQAQLLEITSVKTSSINFLKKVAQEEKQMEIAQKLTEAKKRLSLAEQNSSDEQRKLTEEYDKKKKATLGKMQGLEKDIASKAVDDSSEARKAAAQSLANAVKQLVETKTAPISFKSQQENAFNSTI
jgi:hypothetical protein